MKRLSRLLRRFKQDQRGNVLFIVAGALVLLMGMAAMVIDVGQLYVARRQMVNAADAAALAGVLEAKSNTDFARAAAKEYATENGAEGFCEDNDVYFTGDGDSRIISVRTAKEVHFTFARVLGFDSFIVQAIASAQVGPGNPLVPFVDLGWKCDECCECDLGENCDCGEDLCVCTEECDCEPEENCDKCGGLGYYMKTELLDDDADPDDPENYKSAEEGDHFELKYDRWESWLGNLPGDFPFIRLPGQTGADDLYENLAGGYRGELEKVDIGTILRSEDGHNYGKFRDAVLTRMTIHGEPYCKYDGSFDWKEKDDEGRQHCQGWYKCDLVLVLPLVIHAPEEGNRMFKVVGFVSVLLDAYGYDGDKNVEAWFIEYLDYDQLKDEIMPDYLEGFVTRLVKDPEAALNHFSSNPVQLASQ